LLIGLMKSTSNAVRRVLHLEVPFSGSLNAIQWGPPHYQALTLINVSAFFIGYNFWYNYFLSNVKVYYPAAVRSLEAVQIPLEIKSRLLDISKFIIYTKVY
jgi:hypothetical protein